MKHGSKRFRKSASKSKKFRKTVSKKTNKRTTKRNRITKRRMRRGGFSMLENWNLQKYADDAEIQQKLAYHFNEPMIVGNPSKTLSLLKGFNNQYSSIKLLLKEIGVGEQSREEISKIKKSNVALKKYQDDSEEKERKKRREEEQRAEERAKRLQEKKEEERKWQIADEAAFYAKYGDQLKRERESSSYGVSNSSSRIPSYSERRQ